MSDKTPKKPRKKKVAKQPAKPLIAKPGRAGRPVPTDPKTLAIIAESLARIVREMSPDDWALGINLEGCFPHPFSFVLMANQPEDPEGDTTFSQVVDAVQCPVFLKGVGYASMLFHIPTLVSADSEEDVRGMVQRAVDGVQGMFESRKNPDPTGGPKLSLVIEETDDQGDQSIPSSEGESPEENQNV
jgi:hypothetical protein